MKWKRLIYYLLINVLVSACTTLGILILWDQARSPLPGGLLSDLPLPLPAQKTAPVPPNTGEQAQAGQTPTPAFFVYQVAAGDTFESLAAKFNMSVEELIATNGFKESQPLGEGEILRIPIHLQGSVEIQAVVGPGDLASERVMLKHRGEGELSLFGWRLEDENGNVYNFRQFTLFTGGAVNVYSQVGANTAIDLYWGMSQAVWQPGETVRLIDPQGNIRSSYVIP